MNDSNTARGGHGMHARVKALALYLLPHHLISRTLLLLTRRRSRLVVPMIRWFVRRYAVDMTQAAQPEAERYATFNEFFTRALRDGARSITPPPALACPVDGTVSAIGRIHRDALMQAKGRYYRLPALLGGTIDAQPFHDGFFATLYLAPRDYHRVHMPTAGTLREMCYVPGRLFSVAPFTVDNIPGLFTRNERVACVFDTDRGMLALILVGAINVAAIETVWSGLVTPPRGQRVHSWRYAAHAGVALERGVEMGRFNMGSTVIVLAAGAWSWDAALVSGTPVSLGQTLATPAATTSVRAAGARAAGK